jgi:hypothetical protein
MYTVSNIRLHVLKDNNFAIDTLFLNTIYTSRLRPSKDLKCIATYKYFNCLSKLCLRLLRFLNIITEYTFLC